jgi:hypothetical protein
MLAWVSAVLATAAADLTAPFAPEPRAPGLVVLVAEPFAFDAALGARLAPPSAPPRVVLALDPAPGADPLEPSLGAAACAAPPAPGDAPADLALAERVRAARCVELLGGTWVGWYTAATDARHERAWMRALREAHAEGASVVATGGAAAWVARWSVQPRAALQKPAQDPHDTQPDVPVEGLGLVDGPVVGVLAPGLPTSDRVVERAVAWDYGDVLLLEGPVAWIAGPEPHEAAVAGRGAAAWIDLAAGSRSRELVRGARAALLLDGDVWDARRRSLRGAEPLSKEPLSKETLSKETLSKETLSAEPPGAAPGGGAPTGISPAEIRRALAGDGSGARTGRSPDAQAPWVESVTLALDARSARRDGGGWSGLVLGARMRRP